MYNRKRPGQYTLSNPRHTHATALKPTTCPRIHASKNAPTCVFQYSPLAQGLDVGTFEHGTQIFGRLLEVNPIPRVSP